PGRASRTMAAEVIVGPLGSSAVIDSSGDDELGDGERSGAKVHVLHSVRIGLSGVGENGSYDTIRRIADKVSKHGSDPGESHYDELGAGKLRVMALPREIVEGGEDGARDASGHIHVHLPFFASRR